MGCCCLWGERWVLGLLGQMFVPGLLLDCIAHKPRRESQRVWLCVHICPPTQTLGRETGRGSVPVPVTDLAFLWPLHPGVSTSVCENPQQGMLSNQIDELDTTTISRIFLGKSCKCKAEFIFGAASADFFFF